MWVETPTLFYEKNMETPRKPNLLRSMDFIEMPKSRPMGQVDINSGMDLPPLPQERPVDFVPIPDELQQNVMQQIDALDPDKNPETPIDRPHQEEMRFPEATPETPVPVSVPTPETDFDLFQFTMIKDMIKNLNISIEAMEGAMKNLTDKRDMLIGLLKGTQNDKNES